MEFEVGHAAGVRFVDRFRDLRQRCLQTFEIGDVCALAGEPDCLTFDRDAGLHHVIRHVRLLGEREGEEVIQNRDVRSRHDGADAIPDLDDAEHRERPQRFADERPTYA